jgi:hypothetical protein
MIVGKFDPAVACALHRFARTAAVDQAFAACSGSPQWTYS